MGHWWGSSKCIQLFPLLALPGALAAIPTYYWPNNGPLFRSHPSSVITPNPRYSRHFSKIKGNHSTHLVATWKPKGLLRLQPEIFFCTICAILGTTWAFGQYFGHYLRKTWQYFGNTSSFLALQGHNLGALLEQLRDLLGHFWYIWPHRDYFLTTGWAWTWTAYSHFCYQYYDISIYALETESFFHSIFQHSIFLSYQYFVGIPSFKPAFFSRDVIW